MHEQKQNPEAAPKKDPMKALTRKMRREVLKQAGLSHRKMIYAMGRKKALSSDQ